MLPLIHSLTGFYSFWQNLDYETVANRVSNLRIKVSDGEKSDFADITITLLDVNDNAPVFNPSKASTTVREDAPIGRSLAQIRATDADSGDNAVITYVLGTKLSFFHFFHFFQFL